MSDKERADLCAMLMRVLLARLGGEVTIARAEIDRQSNGDMVVLSYPPASDALNHDVVTLTIEALQ